MNCPEYFEMVEHRLQQEEERACAVLDQATSKGKLLRLVDDVFVAQQVLPLPCSCPDTGPALTVYQDYAIFLS